MPTRRKSISSRALPLDAIRDRILIVRGYKVLLDSDLATLYGVETRRLNEQVRRNRRRFPADFLIELKPSDLKNLMCKMRHQVGAAGASGPSHSRSTARSWPHPCSTLRAPSR
jgi:hypothetical protein